MSQASANSILKISGRQRRGLSAAKGVVGLHSAGEVWYLRLPRLLWKKNIKIDKFAFKVKLSEQTSLNCYICSHEPFLKFWIRHLTLSTSSMRRLTFMSPCECLFQFLDISPHHCPSLGASHTCNSLPSDIRSCHTLLNDIPKHTWLDSLNLKPSAPLCP